LPGKQAEGVLEASPRSKGRQQRRDVVLADHHSAEDHELTTWRPDTIKVGVEQSSIKGYGTEGASAECGSWQIPIVGVDRRRRKDDVGSSFEIVEYDRSRDQIGRQSFVGHAVTEHFGKVDFRRFDRVRYAGGLALPAARNPDRTRRRCRRSADRFRFFAEDNPQSLKLADEGCSHIAGTGANHQKIRFTIPMTIVG
jgi:hypothetical protein